MNNNTDPGKWRGWNAKRPWYKFALALIPPKEGEKVLDLGAGNGEFSVLLKRRGKQIICSDSSRFYVRQLKKQGFKVILTDFNHKLPFYNDFFDGICCLEVIEHVVKAEQLLGEIKRILRRRGWLIISTPNISWCGYRILTLLGRVPFKESYHLRYFNYSTLKDKLKKAGFSIKKEACFTPIPYINRIKQFWLPIKFWPSLLAQDLVFLCRKNE